MEATYWIVLGLILLIGEIFTMDFSLSCFGLACFAAALLSWLGLGIYWQLGAAALTIFVLFFSLRPFMLKYLDKGGKDFKSNVDALAGMTVTVYAAEGQDKKKGKAKIDADDWVVFADKPLKAGDAVKITGVDGNTLIAIKEEK